MKNLFALIPSFSSSGKYSLAFLNITQSLGVINDNVFKFTMAFLLIATLGSDHASLVLSITGAVYVIPFLLFSSSAGILADRFSKQKLLVLMKIAEIFIMLLAVVAFAKGNPWACYSLLFVLSTHSALFGPSKYGIISELVSKDAVSKANGLITSCTYLAVILGTFLASFLTEITNHGFVLIALFCLVVALGGLFSALAIKTTKPQGSHKTVNLFFIREIYHTLKYTRTIRHLLPSIFGSSFFLMIGAFTQLNIIPFAIQSLHLSEVAGGYLFLSTALGIALGSMLAGRASKKKVELGLSCLAGFGIAFFFLLIGFTSAHISAVIICLFFIGVLGGAFIVPFDTFTQISSANEKRGQTIAAANFLSFSGVLIAAFLLFLLNQVCGLTPATSFILIGVLTLFVALCLSCTLSDLFLSYFSRKVFALFFRFPSSDPESVEKLNHPLILLKNGTWTQALQLAALFPSIQFLLPQDSPLYHWYLRPFTSIHTIPRKKSSEELLQIASTYTKQSEATCLILDSTPLDLSAFKTHYFLNLFSAKPEVVVAHFTTDPTTGKQELLLHGP